MRSISESNVTMPAVPPYSSMTSASRTPRRRISASTSSAASVVGHGQRFAGERGGIDIGPPRRDRFQQIDDVQDADDVVQARRDRPARGVYPPREISSMSASRGIDRRHGDHLRPRHHHLPGRQIGEAEHAMEHLLLALFEHAGLLAGRHQHLQLFFRVHHRVAAAALQPERPDDRLAGAVQQADERRERRA